MSPVDFPQSNKPFGPPPEYAESQVRTIMDYLGVIQGGSMDGCTQVVVAWKPTKEELDRMILGEPVFISMIGGLAPHFLSTSFEEATHPA